MRKAEIVLASPARERSRAAFIVLILGFSILMALLARISIPLPFTPVPVTGQTLGVLLAGAMLGETGAAAAMLLYLAQGAAGLPVFAGPGPAGVARFLAPSGGFLLSFPLAAFAVGALARGRRHLLFAFLCGEAIIFIYGACWFSLLTGLPALHVARAAVLPFVPGEIVKIVLALALAHFLGRREGAAP